MRDQLENHFGSNPPATIGTFLILFLIGYELGKNK